MFLIFINSQNWHNCIGNLLSLIYKLYRHIHYITVMTGYIDALYLTLGLTVELSNNCRSCVCYNTEQPTVHSWDDSKHSPTKN